MEMPLMPAFYDVVWSIAVLLVLPLTVVALMRWRSHDRPTTAAVLWVLVILLLPGLGAAVYLAVSSRPAR
ncbi:PLDc N-terminal domain-containing protein [Cellulomonas dongxiuzhuiae]|uniref:PLDc N-terminal domain-containing protein n=1 Tax=Cellulomonas dongxiuzhuiae TaxID=2819979 RepID=UPI001AAF6C07|nr:PLDc N-terminal domain-containing protein [Cellulomonas dongxiuzhuiae]MBO3088837.1 PLDc N-terminal domain-containing protein [Cellulomonas dongxiuzhuiae]